MKNKKKIISAIIAAALCAQSIAVFPLMANAAIEIPFKIDETMPSQDDVTVVSDDTVNDYFSIPFGRSLKGSYSISFDLTVTGELVKGVADKDAADDTFFTFKGGKTGPFIIATNFDAAKNSQSFAWQTQNSGPSFSLTVGKPYHFELTVEKGSTDAGNGTLVITDTETKEEIFHEAGLGLRNYSSSKDSSGGGIEKIEVRNLLKEPSASLIFGPVTVKSSTPEAIKVMMGETELTKEKNVIQIDPFETSVIPYKAEPILGGTITADFTADYSLDVDSDENAFDNDKTNKNLIVDSSLPVGTYNAVLKAQISGDPNTVVECPVTLEKKEATAEQVAEIFKKRINITSADSTITDFSTSNVYEDIKLDANWGTYKVEWSSSNPDVVSDEGVVIPQPEDTKVTMTAAIDVDGTTITKDIELTVKGAKAETQKALDAVVMQDSKLIMVNPNNVTDDFNISNPTYAGKYVTMKYEDADGHIVVDEDGKAVIYPSQNGNDAVKLVATATYVKNGVEVVSSTKEFPLVITTNPQQVVDKILANAGALIVNADTKKPVDLSAVSSDIEMVDKVGGVSFENWKISNDMFKISKSGNSAEICGTKIGEQTGTISADVVYKKGDVVLCETTFEKEITGVLSKEMDAKYIVRCDAAATANFKNCPEDGETIRSADDICDGEGLPTEGIFGSKIEWSSSVPSSISNNGKKVTKQKTAKKVTLTATISKGSAEAEKYVIKNLVVPAKSGSTSTGGSSSGGGSSNTNTTTSSTNFRAPNISYKGTLTPTTSLEKGDITTAVVASFSDLGDAAWAKDAVTNLYNKGIINGKTASSFAPNDDITRAEFAKIVVKAFGLEDTTANVSEFSDVKAGDWYYTAVASAYNKGIIKGYENGTFGVNDKITRQDMAVIIYRAAQVANKTIAPVKDAVTFTDSADIASYASDAVSTLQKGGVINGMTATTFAPKATATRAQAAQMIYGIVK